MVNKSRVFPVIISIIFLVIIIYLFATIKQPIVKCSKTTTDDLGISVKEELNTNINGNKITYLELTKTIILPDKYADDKDHLDTIKYVIKRSYDYLGNDKVGLSYSNNRIVSKVKVHNGETIILDNISFMDNGNLQVKINSNTKSSDVVTLSVSDNYTEGEFKTRMKNNGYVCS